MGARRKARVAALQSLYEVDLTHHPTGDVTKRLVLAHRLEEEAAAFTQELVDGVLEHLAEIDGVIHTYAPNWPVAQLSAVDRNILRLAIFELLVNNKVPVKAAINEAVELAKIFGSDSSPKFVNGVLGSVSAREKPRARH